VLALPVWDDLKDVLIYGRRPRVRVYSKARDYDRVRIMLHHKKDVTAGAFNNMLQRAWYAYLDTEEGR
jgi:hypothetical protein